MIVAIDLHDFSILRSRIDLLTQLKEYHPNLKLSLFTIPFDYEYELSQIKVQKGICNDWIQKNLDWLEFIPHGITHVDQEFKNMSELGMDKYIESIEEEFKKQGLPCVKGFCAPNWVWNEGVVKSLDKNGWWGAVDRNQPQLLRPNKYYRYNLSTDETFWKHPGPLWKLHGHMTLPSRNDLESCFMNLIKYLPQNAEYKFASELVETKL